MKAGGVDCSDHPSTLYSKCHSDMLVHIFRVHLSQFRCLRQMKAEH